MSLGLGFGMGVTGRLNDLAAAVRSLFINNEQGAWYDPSDFERYMAPKGPELVSPANWSSGSTGIVPDPTAGTVSFDGTQAAYASFALIGTDSEIGKWYEITFRILSSSAGNVQIKVGGSNNYVSSVGVHRMTWKASAVHTSSVQSGSTPFVGTVGEISVRELTALDTATLFQDAAGTTPVTAVEQPVGLMLDKRKGLVRGAEVAPVDGWYTTWPGITVDKAAEEVRFDGTQSTYNSAIISPAAEVGEWYEWSFTVSGVVQGGVQVKVGGSNNYVKADGEYHFIMKAVDATVSIVQEQGSEPLRFIGVVSNITVRKLPGNHASQATTTARPYLSARKNLLTYSENFENAVWAKANATIVGDALVENSVSSVHAVGRNVVSNAAAGYVATTTFRVKAGIRSQCAVLIGNSTPNNFYRPIIDLTTGEVLVSGVAGNVIETSCVVKPASEGFFDISVSAKFPTAETGIICYCYGASDSNVNYVGSNGETALHIARSQFETGAAATRYQRVTTDTNYDSAGFPHYLKFDGVDDGMTFLTGSAYTSGGTVAVAAMHTNLSVTGYMLNNVNGGANSGFGLSGSTSNRTSAASGTGSGFNFVSTGGAVDVPHVALASVDGATLRARQNGEAADSTANAANFGGTGWAIGRRADAGSYLTGRIYGALTVSRVLTAVEETSVIRYLASKSGVTL